MARVTTRTLPPLSVLLLHLGACAEAQRWAVGRAISPVALRACRNRDWLQWLRKRLGVSLSAPWPRIRAAVVSALNGDGDGDGSGSGSGYSYGFGDGSGSG